MTDRRSITSRANLGHHVPEALDPAGTTVVGVRLPIPLAAKLDRVRGNRTRSEYLRALLERETAGSAD